MYFDKSGYVNNSPVYRGMVDSMKEEVQRFMENFHDDSRFISGWGHGYFCEEDGGRLIYNPSKPFSHRCSICNKVYRDYQYNACFVTMMRNEAIVTAVKSGILYELTGEKKYIGQVKQIISFYGEHYEEFPIHAKTKMLCDPTEDVGGAGKIMPQGLNEAIIGIRMINAMELIKEELDEEWKAEIKETLFRPIINLLLPQKMHIHNIPTWINSAIGVIGFFFQEKDWIQEATENPFHLFEQLEKGVTESGFWYEGSIHYNFFALEGIMNFFLFAKMYGYQIEESYNKIVLHMLDAAYHYAFDNDRFPNPSDGWPNVGLKTYSYVYYMGCKVFGKQVYKYVKHIERNPLERTKLPLSEPYYYKNEIPLERLMFAPDFFEIETDEAEHRKTASFEASNCAILRNERFNLFLKYGHQTRSHAHPDKMNVEIMVDDKVLAKDLSNSGYASRMCNLWHRKIAAHNTCVWNGEDSDLERTGELLSYGEDHIKARVQAYEGVIYTREIKMEENSIQDFFTVEGMETGVIDWFFHFETPVELSGLKMEPINLFEEYKLIQEVREVSLDGEKVKFSNELAVMELTLEPGMKVYLAKTFNNPANEMRDTVIIRKHDKKAVFQSGIQARK